MPAPLQFLAFFAKEDFLEDIGAEVEMNPMINANFCQCIRHNAPFSVT